MTRKNLLVKGKFFLFNERKRQYFHAKGVEDSGFGPMPYVHWSPYFAGAMGFPTIKQARAMQAMLARAGCRVIILNREREAVL